MPGSPLEMLARHPEVTAAADEARAAVDRLRRHRILRGRSGDVSAESALRGARASAALAGADLPLDDIRQLAGLPSDASSRVLAGALRATAEVGTLASVWRRSPLQALARLHVLAAADLAEASTLGRPLHGGSRLAALAALVTGPHVPPSAVVEAAVMHGELMVLAPFGVGDGVVARAVFRLILVARGLDPGAYAVPEVGHVEAGDYAERLAGYVDGAAVEWVQHCARAVTTGASEGLAVCESMLRSPPPR